MPYFILIIIIASALWSIYWATTTRKNAPFVPSEGYVIEKMLQLAQVGKDDVLYDLGSGDGRIVIAAALRGAKSVGIELDKIRVLVSRFWITLFRLSHSALILNKDFFSVDLSKASVISLFLLQQTNQKLKTKFLRELKPGTKIISYAFTFEGWEPVQIENLPGSVFGRIYLYRIGHTKKKKK